MTANIKNRAGGFTLIELMIVVAILGLLATIALPSYNEYIRRGARADARTALLENAQFLERNFTLATSYSKNSANADIVLPITTSPRTGTALYVIVANPLTPTTYTLSATPVVGGRMDGDACDSLTLTHLGQRGTTGTLSAADCWNR
jgi:type IV pilus assembly protein PilE